MQLTRADAGFSLVELLIGLGILGFLAVLAAPGIGEFLVNSRIRNTAEALANGIKQARMEAVRNNQSVQFVLGAGSFTIQRWNGGAPVVLTTEPVVESATVTVTPAPAGATVITWSSLGLLVNPNPDNSARVTAIDVTSGSIASPHPMRVVADAAIGVKLCDPKFTLAADPAGCP